MLHVSVDPTTTQVFKHITLVRIILYIVYVLTFQVVMQSEMWYVFIYVAITSCLLMNTPCTDLSIWHPLGKNDEFARVHICDSVYHSLSTATTSIYDVHFSHIYNVHITDSSHGPKKGLCPLLDDRSLLAAAVVGDR